MKRMLWFIAVVLIALAVFEFWPLQMTVGVGGFTVEVAVASEAGEVESIARTAFGNREAAEAAVRELWLESSPEPFAGEPIEVGIRSTTRESPAGRLISRHYEKYLVVIVKHRNGRKLGKMVEIPDMAQKVTVNFP